MRKSQYSYDPDHRRIEEERNQFKATLVRDTKTKAISDSNFKEGLDYVSRKSSSSMALADIECILYGGMSSRFWMLRKHMIQTKKKNLTDEKLAFYSWQCITL